MDIQMVSPSSEDFRALATELDAYYFSLVGDIQSRLAHQRDSRKAVSFLSVDPCQNR